MVIPTCAFLLEQTLQLVSFSNPKPSSFQIWIGATRPRTLPAAIAPVLVGSALAWQMGAFRILPATLCLIFALLAQIAANFSNDYFDYVKGADTSTRVGPRRAVASGLISPAAMKTASIAVCVLAFLEGLCLIPFGGWPLLIVGILSILCALAYTGGPYPLGYNGLGDLFVFIFFGLIAVCATTYVQAAVIPLQAFPAAVAIGALTANILVANNYRDVETDRVAGKRTLVVRFGRGFARLQFVASHLIGFLCPTVLVLLGLKAPFWAFSLFIPLIPWALSQYRTLATATEPAALIRLLGGCGQYLAAYAAILSLWIVLA